MKATKQLGLEAATLGMIVLLGACGRTEESGTIVGGSGSEEVYTDSSGDEAVVGEETLKDDGYFKQVVTEGIDPKVKDIVSYDTQFSNSDWDKITFDVDHAKIVTVKDFKDEKGDTYKTLLSLKYKLDIEDTSDKYIMPDKAEVELADGKKVSADLFMDIFDDEFSTTDAHKDGFIHFKIKDEEKIREIKAVDVTFRAKTDNNHETTHTYRIDFPLEAEE